MGSSTYDPLVGQVLDGRYEIVAKVARGGMATVYRARDQRLSRTVAVKIMRNDIGDDDEFAAKFDREARAAAIINHSAVVGVFDQGTAEGQPYIVMEYVDGETLRRLISREAPLRPERALDIIEPVISALASAHEVGLVHRDIKPENILISSRGRVKVADFGLARLTSAPQMTQTGVLVGTASYLPPELVTHSRPDSRADVYSTGVVLFEMLTGVKPHTGENNYQIAYRHVNVDIERPSERLESRGGSPWKIPDHLDAFVQACTVRDPEGRLADGTRMLESLREVRAALARRPGADDPALAAKLQPAAVSDNTQPISARPASRPRPVAAAVGTSTRAPGRDRGATPAPRPTAPARSGGGWEPVRPRRVPQSPLSAVSPPRPIPVHDGEPEDSGRQPVAYRTPVFPPIHVSHDPVHRRRRGALGILLGVLLAVALGTGSWWWAAGRYTEVPAFAGVPSSQVASIAESAHLRVATTEEYSETVAAGTVIDSDPNSGARVLRGEDVAVRISKGPERHAVPTVVGLSRDEAVEALTAATLTVGAVTEVWSETVAEGVVTSTSVEPETQVKRGTAVDLSVSKGREPITIANQTGKEASAAVEALKAAGFKVSTSKANSDTVAAGLVISQEPASGTAHKGDSITLVTSLGPMMITIPAIAYLEEAEAVKKLQDAGFVVKVEPLGDFPSALGIASNTVPEVGKKATKGSTVTLYVA